MIITPRIFNPKKVIAAQSTRLGGVSIAPYSSMNLGLSVNDNELHVNTNRALFFNSLGIDVNTLSLSTQIHGNEILLAAQAGQHAGYDAQICGEKNIFIAVSIADCTPILIHDEKENVVAAIHAGWKGTVANIVENTFLKMKDSFGSKGENCKAFIGACISKNQFEVNEDVATHFSENLKRYDADKHKFFVDLKVANAEQLIRNNIPVKNIEISDYCTVENNDLFFSHRKENGRTGRMMAVIGLK